MPMTDAARMQAAARMRALRQRERDGRIIASVEVDQSITQYLCDAGLLPEHQLEDRAAISAAIGRVLELLLVRERMRR